MKPIQIAAAVLVAAAYSTMVLGAYVKAIGAGTACEQWPACNDNQIVPALDSAGVAAEMFHRAAATTVILSGAALLALEVRLYPADKRLILLTLLAAGVLAVQVALGAITISSRLTPVIVTAHLAVATLFFALSLVLAQRVWRLPPPPARAPVTEGDATARAPADPEAKST